MKGEGFPVIFQVFEERSVEFRGVWFPGGRVSEGSGSVGVVCAKIVMQFKAAVKVVNVPLKFLLVLTCGVGYECQTFVQE